MRKERPHFLVQILVLCTFLFLFEQREVFAVEAVAEATDSQVSGFNLTSTDLTAIWVNKGEALTPEAKSKMIQLFKEDAEANILLEQINYKLGASNLGDVLSIIHWSDPHGSDLAQSIPGPTRSYREYFLPDSPIGEKIGPLLESKKKELLTYRTHKTALYTELETLGIPCLEMPQGYALIDSFQFLVHELIHILSMLDFESQKDVVQFKNLEELAESILMEKGGEFDAFKTQHSAYLRTKKKYGLNTSPELARFFDSDGVLTDSDGLKNELFQESSGLGKIYRPRFLYKAYLKVRGQYDGLLFKRSQLRSLRYYNSVRIHDLERKIGDLEKSINEAATSEPALAKSDRRSAELGSLKRTLAKYADQVPKLDDEIKELTLKMDAIAKKFPDVIKNPL